MEPPDQLSQTFANLYLTTNAQIAHRQESRPSQSHPGIEVTLAETNSAETKRTKNLFRRHRSRTKNMVLVEKVRDAWAGAVKGSQKMSYLLTPKQHAGLLRPSSRADSVRTGSIKDSTLTMTSQIYSILTGSKSMISSSDMDSIEIEPSRTLEAAIPSLTESFDVRFIAQYLDPLDLIKCSSLNVAWLQACGCNNEIWAEVCLRENVPMGPEVIPELDSIVQKCVETGHIQSTCLWKEVWLNAYIVKRNWELGRCGIGHIRVADIRDSVTCLLFDADKILIGTRRHKLTLLPSLKSSLSSIPYRQLPFQPEHEFAIMCIDFSSATSCIGHIAATGDSSGTICIWNMFTGKQIIRLEKAHLSGVTSVLIVERAKFGDMKHNDGGFVTDSNTTLNEEPDKDPAQSGVVVNITQKFAGLLKSKLLKATPPTSANTTTRRKLSLVFRRDTKQEKATDFGPRLVALPPWKGHAGHIYCVKLMSCGTKIVTGSLDRLVRIWDIQTRQCISILVGHSDTVTCVHSVGDYVFSGSIDKTIRKWHAKTGLCLQIFDQHNGWIKCLDSVGNCLITGGWDECIRVWSISDGSLLHTYPLNRGPITSLQADGRKIVTSSRGEANGEGVQLAPMELPND
ncbi:hypothetical protein HDU79_005056 [Rhizoclosmatium sp. JEL0117]|nr:hypothetical protein HDU79_005056 [Rhizoclosmatium sp. JEL0117]